MNAESSYEKFRAAVMAKALKLPKPLEVSQGALWAKSIAVEAFDGKHDGHYTFNSGGQFGFSEMLVNQCVEHAMRTVRDGSNPDDWARDAYLRGYEDARKEFAKATGLYTEYDQP